MMMKQLIWEIITETYKSNFNNFKEKTKKQNKNLKIPNTNTVNKYLL